MTDDISDRVFAERALRRLPAVTPSPGLEAALLAAYDAWNAERPRGGWAAWNAGMYGFCETIWPGAPLWAPVSALAVALLVGAGIGAVLPTMADAEPLGFSLEQPASVNLLSSNTTQEDL
jgi:hypothetical protein